MIAGMIWTRCPNHSRSTIYKKISKGKPFNKGKGYKQNKL